jgi:hypothetical protein
MQFEKSAGIFARKLTANIAARYMMVLSQTARLSARTDSGRAQGGEAELCSGGDSRQGSRERTLDRD